jgi:hypothetical protein
VSEKPRHAPTPHQETKHAFFSLPFVLPH